MDGEFFSTRTASPTRMDRTAALPLLDTSSFDRALTRSELCELLSLSNIELEITLANGLLNPSLMLEYSHQGFLGFFTYWDCLSTLITRILNSHLRDLDAAIELSDELYPAIAATIRQQSETNAPDVTQVRRCIIGLLRDHFLLGMIPVTSVLERPIVDELSDELESFNQRFLRLAISNPPVTVTPFALNILSLCDDQL